MMLKMYGVAVLLCALFPALAPAQAVTQIDQAQALINEARAQAGDGKSAEAVELYRRLVNLRPGDAEVRAELARLLARSRETRTEAEKAYAGAVMLAPGDSALAVERADNLVALGERVKAAVEYQRAFQHAPDNERALGGYIRQVTRLGATPAAIKQHAKSLEAKPDDLALRLLLAELLLAEFRFGDALDHYLIAQRKAPDNLIALRHAAEAWLALGYFERAAELFAQSAPRLNKGLALADRARVLMSAGRTEAAARILSANLLAVEKEPFALAVLADVYRALKQTTHERATLERLLVIQSDNPLPVLERLARLYYEAGDLPAAQEACLRVLTLDPHSAVAATGLSLMNTTVPEREGKKTLEESSIARRAGLDRESGEAALFWNAPERALPLIRRALVAWPGSTRLQLAQGIALLLSNKADEASTTFAGVAIAAGRYPEALLRWAQAEMLRGNAKRALDIFRHVRSLDATNFRALAGEAEALRRTGDNERAAVILAELTQSAPENISIDTQLRETLAVLGRSFQSAFQKNRSDVANDSWGGNINQSGLSPRSMAVQNTEPLLEAGDEVNIQIAGHLELNAPARLDEDGALSIPSFPEKLDALCVTARELGARIVERGGSRLAGAKVSIAITKYNRAPLVVAGAVHIPGKFHVRTTLGLRETLMLASGSTNRAGRNVYVLRRGASACALAAGERPSALELEIYELTAAEDGRVNLPQLLGPGDAVLIPEGDTAFITGAVTRPGVVSVRKELTLLAAVRESGGTTVGARGDHILLRRLLPDNTSHQEIVVDLDAIEKQLAGDVILRAGDIIEIPSTRATDINHSFPALLQRLALNKHFVPMPTASPVVKASTPQ